MKTEGVSETAVAPEQACYTKSPVNRQVPGLFISIQVI